MSCYFQECDSERILARRMCPRHYHQWWKSRKLAGGVSDRPVYELRCIYCGSVFSTRRADSQYCLEHDRPALRVNLDRTCEECGCSFRASRVYARFCKPLCSQRNYRRRNPELHALSQRTRWTRTQDKRYVVTSRDIRRLRLRQGNACFYCNTSFRDTPTMDHVIPLSRGGATSIGNLVLCCRSCNSKKGAKTIMEFRRQV